MEQREHTGRYRAAIIGHTGRGNYGHGLDLAAVGLPGVEVAALADPDEAGRQKALEKTGAKTGYADYREMLERERPELVMVAPRQPDQREAMLLATIRAGAKAIYCEKPFARSLNEADRVLAAADERGVKIAVAHQNRAFPGRTVAQRLIADGKIGRLRSARAYGKQDHRGGGQDLMVLGTHMFDLMRLFTGDARWCHARVCQNGNDATPADVRQGDEHVGLIAGDDIVAQYGFDHGVNGSFESARADDGGTGNYFRLELSGTGGTICLWSSATAPVYYFPKPFAVADSATEWQAIPIEPLATPPGAPADSGGMHSANQILVGDLLAAAEQNRRPLTSGHDARAALEMILGIYAAHRAASRVPLPLADREHPLSTWKA